MRIPSQFNDSSLYRPRRGEKNAGKVPHVPGRAGETRRLIRLVAGLALVIVVMREAGRPGHYETFFADAPSGQTANETEFSETKVSETEFKAGGSAFAPRTESADTANTDTAGSDTAGRPGSPGGGWDTRAAGWDAAARWVDGMDVELQRAWIRLLVGIRSAPSGAIDGPASLDEDQLASSIEGLKSVPGPVDDSDRAEVLQWLGARAGAGAGENSVQWQSMSWWAGPVLEELDRAALGRVSDGTFWTGLDSDAFYLQLASVDGLPVDAAVQTGTLPLLQQPDVYQGQTISLAGRLQLGNQIDAQSNRLGIGHYWKLWVPPEDGGVRPTVLITPDLPELLQRSLDQEGRWDARANPANPDGHIRAVGRFIKRIPYRSSVGADLAPVLIGKVVAAQGVTAAGQSGSGMTPPDSRWGWLKGWRGIVLAVVGGVLLAAALMYRTSIDAKRSRRLRGAAADSIEIAIPTAGDVADELAGEVAGTKPSDGDS